MVQSTMERNKAGKKDRDLKVKVLYTMERNKVGKTSPTIL